MYKSEFLKYFDLLVNLDYGFLSLMMIMWSLVMDMFMDETCICVCFGYLMSYVRSDHEVVFKGFNKSKICILNHVYNLHAWEALHVRSRRDFRSKTEEKQVYENYF
jgi:hypothetical protein